MAREQRKSDPDALRHKDGTALRYHPRSPHASLEALRMLAGVISLTGPVPSGDLFDDEDDVGLVPHARD
jgi:hypothetical protein